MTIGARDIVLLVTHGGDHYTIDRVAEELVRRGATPRRVDTDRFPSELALTVALADAGPQAALRDAQGLIHADSVRALWLRRVWSAKLDDELDPALRDVCKREALAVWNGFFDGLRDRRAINPLDADRAAENKLRQLRLARELGLAIPRTLVTNDPAAVRELYDALEGRVITKLQTSITQSMTGRAGAFHTSVVQREDLDELDGLRHCPMVFQAQVPKDHELRVAVIAKPGGGGQCFVGAIDACKSELGGVDWRRSTDSAWRPGTLPDDVAGKLIELVTALGLVYGAADLIVTPEGEHVFLEVNPAGEWGMLERDLGLPIAAALADALLL